MTIRVVACYHFLSIKKHEIISLRDNASAFAHALDIKGTLLIAEEGFNGTLAGSPESMAQWIDYLQSLVLPQKLVWKDSFCRENPFLRLKVKCKKEIVTMGKSDVDVEHTGLHVGAERWNALMEDPDCVLIDTRNTYETCLGTFPGALDPNTVNFRDFPDFVDQNIEALKTKKVAMFCTGGIRCEKASAYVRQLGVKEVYQLDGGILNYLETVRAADNKWQGECFIFDERVSLNPKLAPSARKQCFACRWPLQDGDEQSEAYVPGVSCSRCIGQTSDGQKSRFAQREKQIQIAKKRGEKHLGRQLDKQLLDEIA